MSSAVGLAWVAAGLVPPQVRPVTKPTVARGAGVMIPNPVEHPEWSRETLERALSDGTHVLFGSSELTFSGEAEVSKMFPAACGRPIVSIGRAGFQSLPILLTLAESRRALSPGSDITIILSPSWFSEFGTPSGAFLKYLKPGMIRELLAQQDLPSGVRTAIARQVRLHRDDLTGLYPDWLLPWMPGAPAPAPAVSAANRAALSKQVHFDWDAAERRWLEYVKENSTNNVYGLENRYFEKHRGRTYPIVARGLDPWRIEQSDVYVLSEFLRSYGVRARFIVQPMHRRMYTALTPYDDLMAEIKLKLEADGHRWVSFFEEPYDLAILEDSVHFSAYGWVRVQREMCK